MDIIPRVGAGCLVAFGVVMFGLSITVLLQGGGDVFPFLLIIAAGTLAGGVYWLRNVLGSDRRLKEQYEEKVILAIASRNDGCVTLGQISLETDLDAAETMTAMDRLCSRGIARADILDDDGTIMYRFGGLLPPAR